MLHLRRWRARVRQAAARAKVFVRAHPRAGATVLAVVVLAAIGFGGSVLGGEPPTPPATMTTPSATPLPAGERQGPFRVLRVLDGATLLVDEVPGRSTTVRLIGIDAPLRTDQEQQSNCLAVAATAALKTMVKGRTVSLEVDPSQDARPLADRQLGNGSPGEGEAHQFAYVFAGRTLVNQALLKGGFATEDGERPYRLQASFRSAEQTARQKGLGIWSPERCGTGHA